MNRGESITYIARFLVVDVLENDLDTCLSTAQLKSEPWSACGSVLAAVV